MIIVTLSATVCVMVPSAAARETSVDVPGHVVGSSAEEQTASAASVDSGRWHTVAEGETLRSIARQHYGSSRLWRMLQVANNTEGLPRTGQRLWLPSALSMHF